MTRRPRGPRERRWPTYAILVPLFAIVCFPVYYGFIGAIMGPADLNAFPSALWPFHGVRWDNFVGALRAIPLGQQYLNSLLAAAGVLIGQLVTSVLAAYALVFLPMRGKGAWFALFMVTMMVPWEAVIIPNYLTIASLGLLDTIAALALPFLAAGFGIFLMRQAFLSFPTELQDAARIDGCGNIRFLARILLPLSKPTLAALGIWSFLSAWNMYFWPLLISQSAERQTIQIGITQLRSAENPNPGLILAGVVLAIIPTLLIVVFGQRFIVRGLTAGSLK